MTHLTTQRTKHLGIMAVITVMTVSLMTANLSTNAYADHGPFENLSGWTAESYPIVDGFSDAVWVLAGDNLSVEETINGQATVFYSDFDINDKKITASVEVQTTDDNDFIGFVLGFNPGDASDTNADYLLVDWKQETQAFDFEPNGCDLGDQNALIGLALSRVSGIPDPDELWSHQDLGCGVSAGGVTELARATNLGGTGWADNTEYTFDFIFESGKIQVFVDGVLELEVEDDFSAIDGRFGFYDYSQINADFRNLSIHTGCSPGFWKTHTDDIKYPNAWPATDEPYAPGDSFESVFGVDLDGNLDGITLEDALDAKGGNKANQLLRFATATLLNADHPDIHPDAAYDTDDEIIAIVSAVDWSDKDSIKSAIQELAPLTNYGCPITGEEVV